MSLHVWLEEKGNSLDPPKLNAKAKMRKLVAALIKERDWILKDMRKEVEAIGSMTLSTLQQIQFAIEDGGNPLWGSFGPMQGTERYASRASVRAAQFHQINETLNGIYLLFPELKPAEVERPKKPETKPDPVKPEGRKKKAKKTTNRSLLPTCVP
jgi:hypothetical protein